MNITETQNVELEVHFETFALLCIDLNLRPIEKTNLISSAVIPTNRDKARVGVQSKQNVAHTKAKCSLMNAHKSNRQIFHH